MTRRSRTLKRATRVAVLATTFLTAVVWGGVAAEADDLPDNLTVHGFLSQAYGRAAHDSEPVVGITRDGTAAYRTAAIQLAYAIGDRRRFVVQLSHERIGTEARQEYMDDVSADWVFYDHAFDDRTGFKVGRIPIPLGIYNQIRDVGTLLPFYRPPDSVYTETHFFSETVDGLAVAHRLPLGRFELDVEAYAGGWDTLAISGRGVLEPARAQDAVGFSSWLETPVRGLRVGTSFFRTTLRRDLVIPAPADAPGPEPRRLWMFSVDGSFSRATVRAEYFQTRDGDSRDRVYSLFAGVRPLSRVSVNVEYSKFWVRWFDGPRAGVTSSGRRDLAIGVNYEFDPRLVLKLEAHDGEGFGLAGPPPQARYLLASVAASF